MPNRYTVWVDEAGATEVPRVGGKFANLAKLHKSGVRVPIAFSVSTTAYDAFAEGLRHNIEKILGGVDYDKVESVEKASQRIKALFAASEIPAKIISEISAAYRELARRAGKGGGIRVAVRSSATSEDLLEASLAGQHDTFLWVKGEEEVVRRVKECWASVFTGRSISYRHDRSMDPTGGNMGVVVQKMVPSSSSGIMFTLNPSNGDISKIAIESSWGLGETIVAGLVTPDSFLVDKVTYEILQRRASKKSKELAIVGDKMQERAVPADRQEALSLSDEQVLALARYAKTIERLYGSPQDIEWALDGSVEFPENLFILQARPETVWSKKSRESAARPKSALDLIVDKLTKGQRTGE